MPQSFAIFAFAIVWLLMSAMLLRAGLRGRRVPAPPWCAKCRFDLSGLNAPARCPECGADLGAPQAVNDWRRVRHRVPLVMGLMGLVLGLGALGFIGVQATTGFSWYHIVPSRILSSWVRSASGPDADRALGELQRRQSIKRLSVEDEARLRGALLARIVDEGATWTAALQDELWIEYCSGAMTEAERNAYVRAMDQSLQLVVRPRVKAGVPLPAVMKQASFRVGPATYTSSTLYVKYQQMPARILRGGVPIEVRAPGWSQGGGSFGVSSNSQSSFGLSMPSVEEPGDYTLEVTYKLQVDATQLTPQPVAQPWSITRSAPFTVVNGSTVRATARDEQTEARIRAGVRIEGVIVETVNYMYDKDMRTPVGVRVSVPVRFDASALPLAFRAIVRPSENRTGLSLGEIEAGMLAAADPRGVWSDFCNAGAFREWRELAVSHAPQNPGTFNVATAFPLGDLRVDVVLVPDADAAERTTNVVEFPNCELTFRGVPVYVLPEGSRSTRAGNLPAWRGPSDVRWIEPAGVAPTDVRWIEVPPTMAPASKP